MFARKIVSIWLVVVILFVCISIPVSADNAVPVEMFVESANGRVIIKEIEGLRQTNSETYLLSDGSYECVVYAEDKYYWDDRGELKLINNSIVEVDSGKNGSTYKNAGNRFDVYFSSKGLPAVSMEYKQYGVSFSAISNGKNNAAIKVGSVENCRTLSELTRTGNNTVRYEDAFGTADLVYVLSNSALKEYIVLEDCLAPTNFSFSMVLDGLAVQQTEK